MADVRSTSGVTPPVGNAAATGAAGDDARVEPATQPKSSGNHSGAAITMAKTVAKLAENGLVRAVVIGDTRRAMATPSTASPTNLAGRHAIEIRTAQGVFTLETPESFPPGTRLTLKIETLDAIIRATVISRDGKPFDQPMSVRIVPPPPSRTALPQAYGPPLTQAVADGGLDALPPAPRIPLSGASVQSRPEQPNLPQMPASAPPHAAKVTGGTAPPLTTQQLKTIADIMPVTANSQQAIASSSSPASAYPASGLPSNSLGASTPTIAPPFAIGETVTARILEAASKPLPTHSMGLDLIKGATLSLTIRSFPSEPALRTDPNAQPLLSGRVHRVSPTGRGTFQSTIETPAGTLRIETSTPPRPGQGVDLALAGRRSPLPLPLFEGEYVRSGDPFFDFGREWSNLRDALEAIARERPDLAQQILTHRIPSAGPKLATQLLFFLTALRGGSLSGWLTSAATDMLRQAGHTGLIQGLEDDFTRMARLTTETVGNDWRAYLIPFFDGRHLPQIQLFLRRHGDGADNAKGAAGDDELRFIAEVELSTIGAIQFDGFLNGRSFNLILRTHRLLADFIRHDILRLFSLATEGAGLSGQLSFQVIKPFPARPLKSLEPMPPHASMTI